MENTFWELISELDIAEERISELKDRLVVTNWNTKSKGKNYIYKYLYI